MTFFDSSFGMPRWQKRSITVANINAGTPSNPEEVLILTHASEKLWFWNNTNAVVTIYAKAPEPSVYQPPQNVYSMPPSPAVVIGYHEFVKVPPGSAFNFENTSAPRGKFDAGTLIGVGFDPDDGAAPASGLAYIWIWG